MICPHCGNEVLTLPNLAGCNNLANGPRIPENNFVLVNGAAANPALIYSPPTTLNNAAGAAPLPIVTHIKF